MMQRQLPHLTRKVGRQWPKWTGHGALMGGNNKPKLRCRSPGNRKEKQTMKRTIITLSATVALATMVATLGSIHTTHAQNQNQQGGSVVGTWLNSVTVDVGPGVSVPLANELVSFGPGGVFADVISIQ